MSLFPFINGDTAGVVSTTAELPLCKDYAWDFDRNMFILRDGNFIVVEGLEAVKVWIYKAMRTPRYAHLGYTWNFGHELEILIGTSMSKSLIQSEAQRFVEECLLASPYILSVSDVAVTQNKDKMTLEFTVNTVYGGINYV